MFNLLMLLWRTNRQSASRGNIQRRSGGVAPGAREQLLVAALPRRGSALLQVLGVAEHPGAVLKCPGQ